MAAANRETSPVVKLRRCVVNFHKQQQIYGPAPEGELLRAGRRREKEGEEGVTTGRHLTEGRNAEFNSNFPSSSTCPVAYVLVAHIPLQWCLHTHGGAECL